METTYNDKHARQILEPCGVLNKYLTLDDRGVWPAIKRDPLLLPETDFLRWQPADELQDLPGAPEPEDTPMLPLPFTARQLAAFMLSGMGAHVADFYGDWSDGPNPERLNEIDPKSFARRAMVEAFAAYRVAQEQVGEMDMSTRAWLTKMVRSLLEPEFVPVVAVPEPMRYDLLATREELCDAFGVWGLNKEMFKNLTERQWLMDARKVKGQGQRGNVIEPLFSPLEVMQGLATKTKKPKLSEAKGWDILEHRFKAVFEEYQQFDPRERTG